MRPARPLPQAAVAQAALLSVTNASRASFEGLTPGRPALGPGRSQGRGYCRKGWGCRSRAKALVKSLRRRARHAVESFDLNEEAFPGRSR